MNSESVIDRLLEVRSVSGLKEYLQAMVDMRREGDITRPEDWKYSCIEDFVLQNGREYTPQPLPEGYEMGKPHECFQNAFQLAQASDLTYVEGFVHVVIPIQHAWCVDGRGMVVDNTLKEPADEYFGVPFNFRYVTRTVVGKETYGVIDNWEEGFPLLQGKDKDFLA